MRVLVVDDETDFRESHVQILELKGHSAISAGSLEDYFALPANSLFELAVIDRQLTDGDGLQILKHIRQTRQIHAVLITDSAEFEVANPETEPVIVSRPTGTRQSSRWANTASVLAIRNPVPLVLPQRAFERAWYMDAPGLPSLQSVNG